MRRRILITGANGFIGTHLTKALAGHELHLLTRILHDFAQPLDLASLPKRIDTVIHLAAKAGSSVPDGDPEAWTVNVLATQQLLQYARAAGASRFVFASSAGVYGYREDPISEEEPCRPVDYYTGTKYAAENIVREFADFYDVIICRFFFPYGPGQRKNLMAMLADKILRNEPITIYNECSSRTNPIYIDDLVESVVKGLDVKGSQTINFGGPETDSILEISRKMGLLLHREPAYLHKKDPAIKNLVADITKMKRVLIPPKTALSEGLSRFVYEKNPLRH